MMHQAGFAPAVSTKIVRLTFAALMAVGAFAVGFLGGPATASADTSVNNCNAVVNVVCVGQISNNPVTVTVGNINPVSNNELNTLTAQLNNVFTNFANISDINAFAVDITTAVQTAVNSWVITTVNNTVTTVSKLCTVNVLPTNPVGGSTPVAISCS
jgi:hypothetical protein